MTQHWNDSTYLQSGSFQQRAAYALLHRYAILEHLAAYDPILVGTFPLNITVPGSDLDIVCAETALY